MRRPAPLPPGLPSTGFSIARARELGVSEDRLRARDLSAPFRAVRVLGAPPTGQQARARAYALRMAPQECFSHLTALALWGVPLPRRVDSAPLHVSVPDPLFPPQSAGVVGHHSAARGLEVFHSSDGSIRALAPGVAWMQSAALLSLDELVVAADFLVTGSEPYDRRAPLASLDELRAAVARGAGRRGIRLARAALAEARYGVLSPQETRLRLAIARAGLPEPVLNHPLFDGAGRRWAMLDGAYPQQMVGYEYQGDQHRSDRTRFRDDTVRRERLADAGWDLLYVTEDDLTLRLHETLTRLRARLARAARSG